MAAEAARKLATYEDLLRLPEDVRAEVLGGELLMAPAPLPEHAEVAAALAGALRARYHGDGGSSGEGPGGWWILPEVDVRLSLHDIVRPDLAGWRRERLPRPWGQRPIEVAPDWVCEVLSPSTALRDRREKKRLYRRSGVGHYWVVDPHMRTLEAWRRVEGKGAEDWRWEELGLWGPGERVRLAPFEEVELALEQLFPPEEPQEEPGGQGA